jgi:hypothetical protein
MAQVVELLLSNYEALSSNPCTANKKNAINPYLLSLMKTVKQRWAW